MFFNLFIGNAFLGIAAGIYLAHYTRFGRTIYAIGGSEQSALLMGLPVAKAKILVYTISGLCSAIAGVVFTFGATGFCVGQFTKVSAGTIESPPL